MSGVQPVRCSILRGGTSRGVFFLHNDLPEERRAIERIFLNVFGSPDVRQINGLGGATSQTSKAAIIAPSSRPDADVDYTFSQVSVTESVVDWGGNCGNLSAAVGPFAIDQGLVRVEAPYTTVRIHNTNTGKIITARVPVSEGKALVEGEFAIPGVPGTGSRIELTFLEPAGSFTGKLLPTGSPTDTHTLSDGRRITASIVDAANPVVFVRATDLGLTGTEGPLEIERRTDVTATLEELRCIAAELLGIVSHRDLATRLSPGLPKVGLVAPAQDYTASDGAHIPAREYTLSGRLMSMQTAHRAYMTTGAVATAVAACIEGTLPWESSQKDSTSFRSREIRIGHPFGIMSVTVELDGDVQEPLVRSASVGRTARHIMDGVVYVPKNLFSA